MLRAPVTIKQLKERLRDLTTELQRAKYAEEIRDMLIQLRGDMSVSSVSVGGTVTLDDANANITICLCGFSEEEALTLSKGDSWNGLARINCVSIIPRQFICPKINIVATLERQN